MRIALGDVRQGWKEEVSTPASFSRFVQPFAYSPVPDAGDPGAYLYKKTAVQDLSERENYLTVEMADALFRRALRLQLHPSRGVWDWRHPMRFGARDLDVCMHAPKLLLFEWNEGRTEAPRKKQQPQGDLLRIGLLILDLYFPDEPPHPDLRDLLSLNEAFRYWQRPYRRHKAVQDLLGQCPVSILQNELIGSLEGDQEIAEKAYFARWHDFLKPSLSVDGQHWKLFPEEAVDWGDLPQAWTDRRGYPEFFYADDKAFVWTCAVLKGPNAHLAKTGGTWAKLLNIDPPGDDLETCTKFEKEWIGKRTYDRWADYGCLYGFNYHSGALAVPESCQVPAWDHFAKMYFDIAMILFYLRLASFRFSARLYRASAKIREKASERTSRYWQEAFEDLRRSFSWFTNIYQFPLISNKQQAIEMYALMRRAMDVEKLFQEIESEIHNSHEYVLQRESAEQTALANTLNIVAMVGLALALAVGFLGVNVFIDGANISWAFLRSDVRSWGLLVAVTLAAASFIILAWTCADTLTAWLKRRRRWWQAGAGAILVVLIGLLFHDRIIEAIRYAWLSLQNMFH